MQHISRHRFSAHSLSIVRDSSTLAKIALVKDRLVEKVRQVIIIMSLSGWLLFRRGLRFLPYLREQASRYLSLADFSRNLEQAVSARRQTIDVYPYPWFTFPFYDYLGSLNVEDKSVLEIGGGTGSPWWALRCKSLTVVETSPSWSEALSVTMKSLKTDCSSEILLDENYFEMDFFDFLFDTWRWDVAVLDAYLMPKRLEILKRILTATETNPQTVLIVDDTDERQYPELAEQLRRHGGLAIPFVGQRRDVSWFSETTLYFPPGFQI